VCIDLKLQEKFTSITHAVCRDQGVVLGASAALLDRRLIASFECAEQHNSAPSFGGAKKKKKNMQSSKPSCAK
jgi:hypothetical protein